MPMQSDAPAPLVRARIEGAERQYIEWDMEAGEQIWLDHGAFVAACGRFSLSARTAVAPSTSWWSVAFAPLRWLYYTLSKKASGERLWSELVTAVAPTQLVTGNPNGGQIERVFLEGDDDVLSLRRGAWIGHAGEVTLSASLAGVAVPMLFVAAPLLWQTARGVGDVYFGAHGRLRSFKVTPDEPLYVDPKALVGWRGRMQWRVQVVRDVRGALFAGEGFALLEGTGAGDVWIDTTDPPPRRLPASSPKPNLS